MKRDQAGEGKVRGDDGETRVQAVGGKERRRAGPEESAAPCLRTSDLLIKERLRTRD